MFFGRPRVICDSVMLVTVSVLCAFLLSSCGPLSSPSSTSQNGNAQAENSITLDPLRPPGADDQPPEPGSLERDRTPDGVPVLQPRGVNVDRLFADEIKDPNERIRRVENAVLELRRDFESVLPAIIRLAAVEKDMQQLMRQLETLLQNEPDPYQEDAYTGPELPPETSGLPPVPAALPPPPVETADAGLPPTDTSQNPQSAPAITQNGAGRSAVLQAITPNEPEPQQQQPQELPQIPQTGPPPVEAPEAQPPPGEPAKTTADGPSVVQFRLGEHGDRSRIVLDASGPLSYAADLDNSELLLVIELKGAAWAAPAGQLFGAQNPLIASYKVQTMDGGQGTRLIVQLKKPVKIATEGKIPADGQNGFRVYMDLAAEGGG